jgi:4-hydroxybenzoate polyprenyltransferase
MQHYTDPYRPSGAAVAADGKRKVIRSRWISLPRTKIRAYLQLMRPPSVITAIADILAGFAVTGLFNPMAAPWLALATVGIFGGGMVLNDLFDPKVDEEEPALPNRQATRRGTVVLSIILFAIGIGSAFSVTYFSGMLAMGIVGVLILYNRWWKRHSLLGPVSMGLSRGANFLLGASVLPAIISEIWYLALLPFTYVVAVTLLGSGVIRGTGRVRTAVAGLLMLATLGGLAALGSTIQSNLVAMLPYLALLVWRVVPPFFAAFRAPSSESIQNAVRVGILSLVVLDAAIAAAHTGIFYGAVVLAFLPMADLAGRKSVMG